MAIQIHDQNTDLGRDSGGHSPVGQNETIPIEPFGVFGISVEEPG